MDEKNQTPPVDSSPQSPPLTGYSAQNTPPIGSIKPLINKENQPNIVHVPKESPPQFPRPYKSNSFFSKTLLLIVCIVVTIFAAGYLGVYYYINSKLDHITQTNTATTITAAPPTITPVPTSTPIPLQTYTNSQPRFSFKFPGDATLDTQYITTTEPKIVLTYIGLEQKKLQQQPTDIVDGYTISLFWGPLVQAASVDLGIKNQYMISKNTCGPQATYNQIQQTTIATQQARYYDILNCNNSDYRIYNVSNGTTMFNFTIMYAGLAKDKTQYEESVSTVLNSFTF